MSPASLEFRPLIRMQNSPHKLSRFLIIIFAAILKLGSGDGKLTGALRKNSSYQVQGLERDAKKVTASREWLLSQKLSGDVSIDLWRDNQLPYIDNLVNLLVAKNLDRVSMDEVKRVLVPNGVAYFQNAGKWQKFVKPRPKEMDDWTHYYYDAKGNATSHDLLVAPPEQLQWVGSPRWSRHHDRMSSLSAQVSSGGRLFYIMDQGSRMSILLPSHWMLTARDAFNGTILWNKEIAHWQPHLWPLKSGPTQLARRLVADGDHIFVTLSIEAPITELDGASGDVLKVFETTKGAEEILLVNGVLYTLVNPRTWTLDDFAPKFNTGDQRRVETEFDWDEKPRQLQAVEVATGKLLWKKDGKVAPLTLASDGKFLIYHDGQKLISLNPATGEQRWASESAPRRQLFEYNFGPRLLLHEGVVLFAGGDGSMKSFDCETGKELWKAPHNKSGYRSPEDLIITGGLVWNAPTTSGSMSGEFIGRDPRTGEIKSQFPPDVDTYWFHHRCYIAKATDRFIIPSRTGIEFVDFEAKHWDINHFVRAACLYGSMPANGLLYAGPHNCACYPEAKLDGLNALSPRTTTPHPAAPPEAQRLEKGPAYDSPLGADSNPLDWPTYRHDNLRSGSTEQPLNNDMGKAWDIALGGRLSPVTIAEDKTFVSQIDTHTVYALDINSGKPLWHFIAGGRVDSPPTYWKGRVYFGCKDGSVYSLRASDGALVWRYRAAAERRHFVFEQLESVWPIPGSVLIENGNVSFISGYSMFLDGGMKFFKLDATTGKKLVEVAYDDKDPETGKDLQTRLKNLQMPAALNDILVSDGKWTYLRTQKIGKDGKRVDLGPVSGNAVEQGAAQTGEGAHIFSPTGFLDDTSFHRSYWVYGKSFAGGYNGYYQAGKYAPSGRILVFNNDKVFSYGREPQYFKWTTTMQNLLFSSSRIAPEQNPHAEAAVGKGGKKGKKGKQAGAQFPGVTFPNSPALDPAGKPITVEAWVLPDSPNGVILSHGGPKIGYALSLRDGFPIFHVRNSGQLASVSAIVPLTEGWHYLVGVLDDDRAMRLYVDGCLVNSETAPSLLDKQPAQPLEFGVDTGGSVGDYPENNPYAGLIDEVAIYFRALSTEEIQARSVKADAFSAKRAAIACSFNNNDARDDGTNKLNGVLTGVDVGKGKNGAALWFHKLPSTASVQTKAKTVGAPREASAVKPTGKRAAGSREVADEETPSANEAGGTRKKAVPAAAKKNAAAHADTSMKYDWESYVPVVTRGMSLAGDSVIVVGAPDKMNEERVFQQLVDRDATAQHDIDEQEASLKGQRGAMVQIVDSKNGQAAKNFKLDSTPVWDGVAVARGCIFIVTTDGKIQCYGRSLPTLF
jgi:outer membrane protein assembly factor BamB